MKIETASATASSISAIDRFSIRIIEPKTERRWGQFWNQNLSLNNSIEALTNNFDDIQRMTAAIKEALETGDIITFEKRGDDRIHMSLNTVELTEFDSLGFYDFLLTALSGRVPPSTVLKKQLSGENRDSFQSDALLFDSLSYPPERISLVENWVEPKIVETPIVEEIEIIELPVDNAEDQLAEQERVRLEEERDQARLVAEEKARIEQQRIEQEAAAQATLERARALAELVAYQNQVRLIRNKITSNLEYPRRAVRLNQEGTIRVSLTLNRDGSISDLTLVEETEHSLLNSAVLTGVEDSKPFDPISDSIATEQTTFEFPIGFYLQD